MIDHVAVPLACVEEVEFCSPMRGMGRKLQAIPCVAPRDHIPVLARL